MVLKHTISKYLFTLLVILSHIPLQAGNYKGNHSLLINYNPRQYQAGRQIWDICQGKNGLMYFVAGEVVEHGDNHWLSIPNDSHHILRSIHSVSNDTLLTGGSSEIGLFIKENIPGNFRYKSLMPLIDKNKRDFGEIWQIEEQNGQFFLRAGKAVFQYNGDTINTLTYGSIVEHIQFVNDSLYIHSQNKGLGILDGNHFIPVPGGELFKDKFIRGIEKHQNGPILIFTRNNGIFIQKGKSFIPFKTPTSKIMQKVGIQNICQLPNKEIAIGTIKDGLFIIDNSGSILQHVNKRNGLNNNTILSLTTDYKGNLWVGLDKGIAYLETSSNFSVINSPDDIGTGYVSELHNNHLYLGTNQGLFSVTTEPTDKGYSFSDEIKPVQNTTGQVWSLNRINNRLYSGQHTGTFLIDGNKGQKVNDLEGVWIIKALKNFQNLHLASTYRGFFLLKQRENGWLDVLKKINIPGNSREFMEDSRGNIWRTSGNNTVIRFKIDKESFSATDIEKYHIQSKDTIPERIKVLGTYQRPIFATDIGIFEFNPINNQFVKNDFFNNIFKTNTSINEILEDRYNRVWYSSRSEIGYYSAHLGQVRRTFTPFEKIKRGYTHSFGYINVLSESDILFPYEEGFIHYNGDPFSPEKQKENFRSYIAQTETYSSPDSWISGQSEKKIPVFKFADNSIQFTFSANSFENPEDVEYTYLLEGFNESWSEFSNNTLVNFTNLREGDYTIKVKARDIYGYVSQPETFRFRILPPFYRSKTSFFIYALLILFALYVLYRLRKKQLLKERKKMELQKTEELEVREQEFQKERLITKERITHLENEKLQQDLKHKARELSNSTLNVLHKNELLQNIKQEIQTMSAEKDLNLRNNRIRQLIRNIDHELEASEDLKIFDSNLNAVHEEFVDRLKNRYPNLTPNDIRLCIFLKMNKTTKEIATLMNLSIRGIETSRYRLRKKMDLGRDENLSDVILDI
jgi:DNA-binding CsgD family transcriptional regulator